MVNFSSIATGSLSGEHSLPRFSVNSWRIRYILDYLRTGELDVAKDSILRRQILREATYYNIVPLINLLTVREDTSDLSCTCSGFTLESTYTSLAVYSLSVIRDTG